MLDRANCLRVNVTGIRNIIDCCMECNINKIIYTSTYNVIYGGQQIINGDENMDYFPIDLHTDYYGPSKTIAERLMRDANNKETVNGQCYHISLIIGYY